MKIYETADVFYMIFRYFYRFPKNKKYSGNKMEPFKIPTICNYRSVKKGLYETFVQVILRKKKSKPKQKQINNEKNETLYNKKLIA